MAELLVVRSKLKDVVNDMNISGDLAEHLSKEVEKMLEKAAHRAKENGRRTIQAKDL